METRWLSSTRYRLYRISARPLPARLSLRTLVACAVLGVGTAQAIGLLRRLRPGLVIGVGGYASAPVLWAAASRKIPTHIHEMDAVPGRANRFLANRVTSVTTGFPDAGSALGRPDACWTGNPVRPEFFEAERDAARKTLAIPSELRVLLASGGSRGAARLNSVVLDAVPALVDQWGLFVLHITGADKFEEAAAAASRLTAQAKECYRAVPFLGTEMPLALAAADLALCRAGASTLAELAASRLPAVLVPYPFATGRHQEANARFFETRGAARVVLNSDLTSERLCAAVSDLLGSDQGLARMRESMASLRRPDAAREIARTALEGTMK